ncbi:nuclear transport factor 2 family protein [Microbacterium sp. W4I20]|uniref:nuclear transport factor 2 family protein n=1 Tax=Microbacterium sp. W4I20 TaxID=3042262 RepID=UPI00277DA9CC|nr:nuclear transport factor 2 family protein [Microbacterium sp. W4I20]MDQ0727207.1 ketosteroid isomerase-like protein [Microbacterium sp. W4I20]
MTTTEHDRIIEDWITAANSHDRERFLSFFTTDAVLDDPSVGDAFAGRERVGEYFDSYFLGYDTQTRLVSSEARGGTIHVEVHFTGSFPGGETGGTFDLTFDGELIHHARADLL